MVKFFLPLLFISASTCCVAQERLNTDSLLQLLPKAKEDSNKVLLYINIGQQYEGSDMETAKQYYLKAKALSEKISYPAGVVKFYSNYTQMLNLQGLFDSSLALNLEGVALARKLNDPVALAKSLFNTGSSYRLLEEYENAIKYYEEGKNIFARLGVTQYEGQIDDVLQNLATAMHQYQKGVNYGRRAVASLSSSGNPGLLSYAYNNLGLNYTNLQLYDSARYCFEKAALIAAQNDDLNVQTTTYLNLGNLFLQQGNYKDMKPYMEKALRLAEETDMYESEAIALKGLSIYHLYQKEYAAAKACSDTALKLANQYDFRVQRQKIYLLLADISYAMQDLKAGDQYGALSELLADSILNESITKNTIDIEKKYETEKKENQIKLQKEQLKQKNIYNYMLLGGILTLLAISLLAYRNYSHRQKLQQVRIDELETEKKLTATEAVLKGEEQERTRLAKDLHDGLGGMLSGIKYSLSTMKGNLIMTPENAQAFERSMDMLDSSIQEMRRVAHNMMPEALVKFGLDTALKDFCNDINQSGAVQVSYQSIGLENQGISQTTAITIYRIVQELINNAIKHAAATKAIVQVSKAQDDISITVEDNGKGFDPVILKSSRGIGWDNIQSRVEYLKGKIDVQSAQGKGTSVLIELTV